jgi:hypothetical protein
MRFSMLSLAMVISSCVLLPSVRAQQANLPQQQHVIPSIDGPTLFVTTVRSVTGKRRMGVGPWRVF